MATQSTPPANPPNPDPVQAPMNEGQAKPEPARETSQTSMFVNSQPIREDQIQNAVNFLSHPRVRGSPIVSRRNFLERKGLTKEEIDEAFRRVPDPSPSVASGQNSTPQEAQRLTAPDTPAQTSVQGMQPTAAAPTGIMATMTSRFHWSHAVFAIGFLAISGAGTAIVFKNSVLPRLKSWICRVVLDEENDTEKQIFGKPSFAEETAMAAKAAAAAAADVAEASQEMLITKNEEKKCFAEFMSLLDVQLQEMRTMRNAITKLEGQTYSAGRNYVREEYLDGSVARSNLTNGKDEYDTRSVRSASPPVSAEPPHPQSYKDIMAMVQRGQRPPNVRPWEVSQPAGDSSYVPQTQVTSDASSYSVQDNDVTYQLNNESPAPWWQQKNVRLTEMENGEGQKPVAASNDSVVIDRAPPRRWIPPQPPPVSMPEAAVAIRQPKSSVPKDANLRAEEATQPVSDVDELHRITQISESGGQLEKNRGSGISEINSSEIQEEVTEL